MSSLSSLDANHTLFYAPLSSESVCTENLTPFLKLLPCKSRSGIAMLLNPHRLFDADWHGMGVHVLWLADQGIQLRLTVSAVFDPVRLSGDVMKRGAPNAVNKSPLQKIHTVPKTGRSAPSSVARFQDPALSLQPAKLQSSYPSQILIILRLSLQALLHPELHCTT